MMVPTNRLRQVEIMLVADDWLLVKSGYGTVTGYKLQQWWYDESADAKAQGMTRVTNKRNDIEPEHGYGEWRDVEIVEE